MRYDQYIGLNERAQELVRQFDVREIGHRLLPDGTVEPFDRVLPARVVRVKNIGVIQGAWNDNVAPLRRYILANGRAYDEFVQAAPWCSGPNYFIALKDACSGKAVRESLWTEREMGF